MTSSSHIPDFMERKGSLFLRSDHMDYGRPTLVSNWHQAREAEPKDYDMKEHDPEKRHLHLSTYTRVGNVTDGGFPISTSHDQMAEAIRLKNDFQPRTSKVQMVGAENIGGVNFNRDTGCPSRGYGSVLPRNPSNHNKRYLDTTHNVDFQPPFPYEPQGIAMSTNGDTAVTSSPAVWKKCHSQFTDVDDYRRRGNNMWHEQSGCYATSELRSSVVPKTDTIPSRLL